MRKRIFIVSKFKRKANDYNKFHFKGFYQGIAIKEILVQEGSFQKGEEYILAVDEICIEQGSLIVRLVKSRLLFT